MGLFDRLTFKDGLDIEFPAIGADPFDITWQTKSIARHPLMMDTYKITPRARLLKETAAYERVLEEARPGYNDEIGGFEREIDGMRGAITKIDQGWSDMEYHGTFEFHGYSHPRNRRGRFHPTDRSRCRYPIAAGRRIPSRPGERCAVGNVRDEHRGAYRRRPRRRGRGAWGRGVTWNPDADKVSVGDETRITTNAEPERVVVVFDDGEVLHREQLGQEE